MSVGTYTKSQTDTDGSTTQFQFSFSIESSSDLTVIYTDGDGVDTVLTETSDYTVAPAGADYSTGGVVTTLTVYPSGGRITIVLSVPVTQDIDFTEGMPTLYETFEAGLDRLTRIAQQQAEALSRAVSVPISEVLSTTLTLPSADERAGKFLQFGDDGEPLCSDTAPSSCVVSSFMEGVLTCEDADAFAAAVLPSGSTGSLMVHDGSNWTSLDTTEGDIIYRGSSGLTTLSKGSAYKTLSMDSTGEFPEWADSPQSVLTEAGDILYASAANTLARLAKGSANQALVMNASGSAPMWGNTFKIGLFSREMTASSGNVSYTGVGFTPRGLLCFGANGTAVSFFIGAVEGSATGNCASIYGADTTGFSPASYLCRLVQTAGSIEQTAVLYSWDSDGFTLTWTKVGSPSSTTYWVWYIAWR